eukprot:g851.t1
MPEKMVAGGGVNSTLKQGRYAVASNPSSSAPSGGNKASTKSGRKTKGGSRFRFLYPVAVLGATLFIAVGMFYDDILRSLAEMRSANGTEGSAAPLTKKSSTFPKKSEGSAKGIEGDAAGGEDKKNTEETEEQADGESDHPDVENPFTDIDKRTGSVRNPDKLTHQMANVGKLLDITYAMYEVSAAAESLNIDDIDAVRAWLSKLEAVEKQVGSAPDRAELKAQMYDGLSIVRGQIAKKIDEEAVLSSAELAEVRERMESTPSGMKKESFTFADERYWDQHYEKTNADSTEWYFRPKEPLKPFSIPSARAASSSSEAAGGMGSAGDGSSGPLTTFLDFFGPKGPFFATHARPAPLRLLILGCGTSDLPALLQKEYPGAYEIVATDWSPSLIEQMQKRYNSGGGKDDGKVDYRIFDAAKGMAEAERELYVGKFDIVLEKGILTGEAWEYDSIGFENKRVRATGGGSGSNTTATASAVDSSNSTEKATTFTTADAQTKFFVSVSLRQKFVEDLTVHEVMGDCQSISVEKVAKPDAKIKDDGDAFSLKWCGFPA